MGSASKQTLQLAILAPLFLRNQNESLVRAQKRVMRKLFVRTPMSGSDGEDDETRRAIELVRTLEEDAALARALAEREDAAFARSLARDERPRLRHHGDAALARTLAREADELRDGPPPRFRRSLARAPSPPSTSGEPTYEELVALDERVPKRARVDEAVLGEPCPWPITAPQVLCTVCQFHLEAGEIAMALPCLHSFHAACIRPWLDRAASCPVCHLSVALLTEAVVAIDGTET